MLATVMRFINFLVLQTCFKIWGYFGSGHSFRGLLYLMYPLPALELFVAGIFFLMFVFTWEMFRKCC